MTKGRRTNNRHKRKRLPDDLDLISKGTQAGTLHRDQPYETAPVPTLEERRQQIDAETEGFLDRIRKRFQRKDRR